MLAAGALLALVGGCTPMHAATAVEEAEKAVHDAQRAGAEDDAPYGYWMAKAYLSKAKRLEGHAAYVDAEEIAREATELARKAAESSSGGASDDGSGTEAEPAEGRGDGAGDDGSGEGKGGRSGDAGGEESP